MLYHEMLYNGSMEPDEAKLLGVRLRQARKMFDEGKRIGYLKLRNEHPAATKKNIPDDVKWVTDRVTPTALWGRGRVRLGNASHRGAMTPGYQAPHDLDSSEGIIE